MVCETYKLLQPTSAKDNDGSSKDNNDDDSSKENKTKIKNKNGSSKSSEEKNDQNKKEEKTSSADNEQERIQKIQRQKSQLLDIEQQAEIEVTTLFATIKHGLLKQDSRSLEAGLNSLLGKKILLHIV